MRHGHYPESRKFNIAVITYPFHDEVGKATLANLIEVLEPLSREIFIITGDFPRAPNKNIHIARLKTDVHKGPLAIRIAKFVLAELRASLFLIRICRRVEIVIFHIGTGPYLLSTMTARLLGKKVVVGCTGRFSKYARQQYNRGIEITAKLIERIRFAIADQIAVQSPTAVHLLGLDRYKQKIAINGAMYINTDLFKITKDSGKRENLIGYVGRLVEGKGIMEFLDAVPLILKGRDDAEFPIGGGGPLYDEIVNKLQTNGLHNEVKLIGWIPHEELPDYLNDLKLLVLPSDSEGLPGIVQEAMACGAVVLATPVGGIPDLIKDGETGFILENNSPECIARGVINALKHTRLDEIAQSARQLIEREYAYDTMVDKYRQALDILNNR